MEAQKQSPRDQDCGQNPERVVMIEPEQPLPDPFERDRQTTAQVGSVFMCRLCNLFSPSRSLLLAHCSQLHPQQEPGGDIIVALQPLAGDADNPVKRKRGRPKGSTKKTRTEWKDGKSDRSNSQEDEVQREEGKNKEDGDAGGEGDNRVLDLKCRDCHRLFSNRRQILKHICLSREAEEEEDGNGDSSEAGADGSGNPDPQGDDLNRMKPNSARSGLQRATRTTNFRHTRASKRSRPPSDGQSRVAKEDGLAKGSRKSVISVVLTEDETLPGVLKMVPVENSLDGERESQDTQAASQQPAALQDQSQAGTGESTTFERDQEPSSNPGITAARGFQEYSIKQDATNLLQSQLKIFACQFCNKIFKFRHSLISHLRTHTQEKPFKCPHCEYASAIKANLNVHLRKHTGEKFSCQHCPFTCLSPGHLKVHVERVHLKVKQHCTFCQKKYSDVKNLLMHVEKWHNMKDPAVLQMYQQLKLKTRQGLRQLLYHCPTCNRRFKNKLVLERHLLVHGPQRPFACLLCDHAATKMSALAAHVRKHPFLYVCTLCDGKFVSSQRLKLHLQEAHPDVDQEQGFTGCINHSFYLMQPVGGVAGDDARSETEREPDGEPGNGRSERDVRSTEEEEEKGTENDEEGADSQENIAGEERAIQLGRGDFQEVSIETTSPPDTRSSDWHRVTTEERLQATSASADDAVLRQVDNGQRSGPPLPGGAHATPERTPLSQSTRTPSGNPAAATAQPTEPSEPSAPPRQEGHAQQTQEVSGRSHQSAFQQVFSSLQKSQLDMETFQRLRKMYGELECQYCGKLFWYKVHYNAHVRTHTKEHLHYCSKCSYSSITKSSLKRHLIQKHSGLLLPCSYPGCKYSTPDKYKLQAHQKTHQDQGKSAACPVCHQSFPEHRLKHHVKTSHPDAVPSKGLMVKRAEKCPYCDSYFLKTSSDFQQHIWAHQGLKPYLCSQCDYAGRSRSNLKTHMNRHSKDRCHVCDLCGKTFKSKGTLKSHRLSHTDEGKRFKCSECDFTSVSKPSLLRHMEQHAEFKPFRCAHCHYSCNIAGPLKRHYSRKHPDQEYQNAGSGLTDAEALKRQGGVKCPECKFVYGTKWELNRHLKKKHGPKAVEGTWEVEEAVDAQYVPAEDEEHLTEAHVSALQDNGAVNILQHIAELSTEAQSAVTSMVAVAPGTVAVVEQLQVADEKEICGNQLMVVNAEGHLTGDQVMVVEEGHDLEALTVLTQGENAHHYIVYVQEHTVEIN